MPIFQDPDDRPFYELWFNDPQMAQDDRQHDYHDTASATGSSTRRENFPQKRHSENPGTAPWAQGREELIHNIKTAETSRWSPYHSFGDAGAGHHMLHIPARSPMEDEHAPDNSIPRVFQDRNTELASPAEIQRPRSALHSGDFREGTPQPERQQQIPQSPIPERSANFGIPFLASSPTTPWFAAPSFPSRTQTAPLQALEAKATEADRSPAPSRGSFSSSYVLKAPTTPLVHQANNTDLDFSPIDSEDQVALFNKANRRRTLPPDTFRDLLAASPQFGLNIGWDSLPNQSRHSGRSLTSAYSLQLASSIHGPSPRPRRPSLSSEMNCRPHAPMVGSYEESILRGRMSTCPSKPLDFTAQIGVLGKSKGKSSLKCPPHVTVPFPAVFYSYSTSGHGRTISDDSPSPYVGMIDLENSLPKDSSTSRRRRRHQSPVDNHNIRPVENATQPKSIEQESLRRREKRHRRTESPKSPPGGCYRIPERGQLQIMIKNPNKTAVKLFLVPYDLSDMEPGTKTFIRQRSYSAGPILDMPLSARSNYGTDRPEASLTNSDDPNDKPVLRYLIHLNICCPSRGRYYLHSSIRVVFANRVPDGKEKLRNEIQHPEPRYSPYKASRDPNPLRASARFGMGNAPRGSSPRPPSCRVRDEHRPHPFRPIPSIRSEIAGLGSPMPYDTPTPGSELYNKLTRGDAGYGGYRPGSIGNPEGESLLAKKLRGLDVQKP
ncbi:uncharacterized protein BDV17DRAFT_249612, partial [Aspergillus undulatus]|uniref:uncharacterized protein n=1 Tax=Aspergillus undulatus TaxID=1810928 RepID=UPI003CCDA399